MKKCMSAILCLIYLSAGTLPALANSAPSYWASYPYSEVLAVDENSPITVSREQLVFDFSERYGHGSSYAPVARVEASYEMVNPTDDTLRVQMAFPFVASLTTLSVPDLDIRADGEALPYQIFIDPNEATAQGSAGSGFSYGGIGDISNAELTLAGFDINQAAKLYRFELDAGDRESLDFRLSFDVDADKTILLASGFNGYSHSDEGNFCLSARVFEQAQLEIIVLGEDLKYTTGVYDSNGEVLTGNSGGYKLIQRTVQPKEYLLSAMREAMGTSGAAAISDTQLFNLCLTRLRRDSMTAGFVILGDILSAVHSDRIITLVYTVEFPAGATREVSVSYLTDGVMDRTETVSPKYSYTYLLSPAAGWADFGSLDIALITPEAAPYIIDSSVALSPDGEGRYTARLDGLPDSELTFTLYEKEQVTFLDRMQKAMSKWSYVLYFLWPVIAVFGVLIVILTIKAVARRGRRG